MKNKNSILQALLVMFTIIFSAYSMEQSMIGSQSSSQKMKNAGSFIRKAMNEDLTNKTARHKTPVYEKINELIGAKVLSRDKKYPYVEDSKLDIINQFFTKYPKQVCPELQVIADKLNDPTNHQDFMVLLPKLKKSYGHVLQNSAIDDLTKIIQNKKDVYTDNEIEAVKNCLKTICSSQSQKYKTAIAELKKVITSEKTKSKLKISRKNILQSKGEEKEANVEDLIAYKKEAEIRIAQLKEPKTAKEETLTKQYQESVKALDRRIDLLTEIDKHILQDYSKNSLQENEENFINLLNLKKELNKPGLSRDKKLNKKLDELSQLIKKAVTEEIDATNSLVAITDIQDAVEKLQKLRQFPIELESKELPKNLSDLDSTLYDLITDQIKELQNQIASKQEEEKLEQEWKEQGLLEQVRLAEEQQRQAKLQRIKQKNEERETRINKEVNAAITQEEARPEEERQKWLVQEDQRQAEIEQQKLEQEQLAEEQRATKLAEQKIQQERLEQKRAQQWRPWINRNFTIFIRTIQEKITSWWSWFTGRY